MKRQCPLKQKLTDHHKDCGITNATHRKFVVVVKRAAARSWYGQDEDRRCTAGKSGARSPGRQRREARDRAGPSWWP
jgi:hypothetical protein